MTLARAAAASMAVHLSVFALLGTPGTTMQVPARQPELMVWCTLAEDPVPATAVAEQQPVMARETPAVPEPVAVAVEPEPAAAPAPAAPAPEPVLTATVAAPVPLFTAPAAITPPALPARPSLPAPVPVAAPVPAGVGNGVVTVSELRYRSAPPPDYPALARRRGYAGTVRVQVEVDVRGRVSAVSLAQSSGYPVLDAEALRAVRDWSFAPVMVDGVPRTARGIVPVRFVLR